MKERAWLAAFILAVSITGIVAIDQDNRWWWFLLVVPGAMVIYLLARRWDEP